MSSSPRAPDLEFVFIPLTVVDHGFSMPPSGTYGITVVRPHSRYVSAPAYAVDISYATNVSRAPSCSSHPAQARSASARRIRMTIR